MAYVHSSTRAGSAVRRRRTAASTNSDNEMDTDELAGREDGYEFDEHDIDWGRIGTFTGILALGTILGAAAALLFAPNSGEETRGLIADRTRRFGGQARDGWDDLRDELEWAASRGRKRMRRGFTRGGWAAEDAVDRGRRRVGL